VASAAYLAALRRLKKLAVERRVKVRYFPAPVAAAAAPAGQTSASADGRRAGGAAGR
jgi:hypothetical protein